ncbi:hypothetical protein Pth03_46920 [Planotetraspora thailandica]|uniref:Uncharacterized protein n=1 Tax=Planotetraspora thailandica TaxID=487172 RepID=A0A8J3V3W4_9ACTN|nr:hypothetical protein [Planotetraspora thailandica]GII56303.1 hypothetical protein Pth03_46920 [Planotetraspora thailandica]
MSIEPDPPGKRYRLRGLLAVTLVGIASWALIIWAVIKIFG